VHLFSFFAHPAFSVFFTTGESPHWPQDQAAHFQSKTPPIVPSSLFFRLLFDGSRRSGTSVEVPSIFGLHLSGFLLRSPTKVRLIGFRGFTRFFPFRNLFLCKTTSRPQIDPLAEETGWVSRYFFSGLNRVRLPLHLPTFFELSRAHRVGDFHGPPPVDTFLFPPFTKLGFTPDPLFSLFAVSSPTGRGTRPAAKRLFGLLSFPSGTGQRFL